jgi:hypothetical protein
MARFLITILSWLFGIGMIGCAVVILMTFWEDLLTILGHEERKSAAQRTRRLPHDE